LTFGLGVGLAEPLDEGDDLAAEGRGEIGEPELEDGQLPFSGRVVDPVEEAAALERVVHFAGAVAGENDARRARCPDGAYFRDRHREIAQQLEQERLELLVGAIDLVDQQHGRLGALIRQRGQERPPEEKLFGEDALRVRGGRETFRLQQSNRQHLARVVPLVERSVDVEAFVALEPDQRGAEGLGQHARHLGLADAGFALEEQRAMKDERQVNGGRQVAIGHISVPGERGLDLVDRHRFDFFRPTRSANVVQNFSVSLRAVPWSSRAPVLAMVPRMSAPTVQWSVVAVAPSAASATPDSAERADPGAAPRSIIRADDGGTRSASSRLIANLSWMLPTPSLATTL